MSGEKVGGRASGCGPCAGAGADADTDEGDMVCRFYDTIGSDLTARGLDWERVKKERDIIGRDRCACGVVQ